MAIVRDVYVLWSQAQLLGMFPTTRDLRSALYMPVSISAENRGFSLQNSSLHKNKAIGEKSETINF